MMANPNTGGDPNVSVFREVGGQEEEEEEEGVGGAVGVSRSDGRVRGMRRMNTRNVDWGTWNMRRGNASRRFWRSRLRRSSDGRLLGARGGRRRGGGERRGVVNSPIEPETSTPQENPIVDHWKRLLGASYELYYLDSPPGLPDFERKANVVDMYLQKIGFLQDGASAVLEAIGRDMFYSIGVEAILMDEEFSTSWVDFESELENEPEQVIKLWNAVAHRGIYNILLDQQTNQRDDIDAIPGLLQHFESTRLQIGFSKDAPITPLKSLKSTQLGKFMTVKGSVVRCGNIRPFTRRLTFHCKACETDFPVDQVEGCYTLPKECKLCSNDVSNLFDVRESAKTTVVIDSRRIRVQDMQQCDLEKGAVPRTVDILLLGDLVDQCSTGEAITVTGILKMSRYQNNTSRDPTLHNMYIEASSVMQHKESESLGPNFEFTEKDFLLVQTIFDTPDLFRLLVASLCPSIFGNEMVKAGLLLCLFGGTPHAEQIVDVRSDINMLMLGDPGIGKSQMLKVIQEVAPKGVYVCGTGSTVAGLTVTLVKEGDDYSLEAGALVMSDRGICCIDEFDKMTSQHHALLEAMEQQSVSVAKSGVYRTLSARCSVIASANPVGGHYDLSKTVSENIKINPALLSRFDLIFIMIDRPDKEFDQRLVDHIAGIRGIGKPNSFLQNSPAASAGSSDSFNDLVPTTNSSEASGNSDVSRSIFKVPQPLQKAPRSILKAPFPSDYNAPGPSRKAPLPSDFNAPGPSRNAQFPSDFNAPGPSCNAQSPCDFNAPGPSCNAQFPSDFNTAEPTKSLIERLRVQPGEVVDLIPHVLLRKYIAYARMYVFPKLSPEAAEVLKNYYLHLRRTHRGVNCTPVTARQLESLIRLTQARAKIELRETATVQDANDVLEIFGFSLSSIFDEEVRAVSALSIPVVLADNSPQGKSKGRSIVALSRKVLQSLQTISKQQSKNIFSVDEIKSVATTLGFSDKGDSIIATLNNEGILLKKPGKTYQLSTTDY